MKQYLTVKHSHGHRDGKRLPLDLHTHRWGRMKEIFPMDQSHLYFH